MLDVKDKQILNILQANSRTTNAEIARRVGMAPSAVLDRTRKLEDSGIILSYEARLNTKKLGLGLTTFIFIRTDENIGSTAIGEEMSKIPQVQEVHFVAGEFCYLLKVRVRDTDALSDLLRVLGGIKGIKDSRTTLILQPLHESLKVHLEDL